MSSVNAVWLSSDLALSRAAPVVFALVYGVHDEAVLEELAV